MTTIEDKIRLFSKIIYDKIKEEKQVEFDSFEAERRSKLEELNQQLELRKIEELQEAIQKAKLKSIDWVSREKIKSQQRELSLKDDMMKQIMEGLKNRIHSYVETEDYNKVLLSTIKNALQKLNKEKYILYLTNNDFHKLHEELEYYISSIGIELEFKEAGEGILGGFLIEEKDRRFRIDNSLGNKLLQLKDFIGLRISESLK